MAALRRRLSLAALASLALAGPAAAQHALVLGGGGARGLAHAGVLVALERLGYDTPLVVGTSMGAAIGALYAAGYSPAEIRDIVAQQDWSAMFAADPFPVGPDRQPRRPMLSLGFSRGRETVLEGFIAQGAINRRLVQLLFDAGVRAGSDFDSLPRRFRAITADLRTGREYVIARGDLPRAVRASMAVPGVFSPIRWGERVLVDGGVANNLGISVARALTADSVIAVDVVRPPGELLERSALAIGSRAIRLLLHNARGGRDSAELLVVPPIPAHFSEATFPADATPLIRAGLEGAEQLPPRGPPHTTAPRRGAPPPRIDSVVVEGVYGAVAALVQRSFADLEGPYDPDAIVARMDALYATGVFHAIWPRVERDAATQRATLVVLAEPISPGLATGAAGWDTDMGARAWAAVRARTELRWPLELRMAGSYDRTHWWIASSGTVFSTRAPPWGWTVGGHLRERHVRTFAGDELVRDPRVQRAGGWVAAEWRRLRPQQAFTLALRAEQIRAQEGPDGTSVGPYLRFGTFPPVDGTVGIENVVEAELRFGELHYARLHASGSTAVRAKRTRLALLGSVTAVTPDAPLDAQPALGGSDTAPWLRGGEARSRSAVVAGGDVARALAPELDIRLRVRAGATASELHQLRTARWIHGAELGAVWRTALGPITTGLAVGAGGRWRLNLGAGSRW